MAVSTNATSGYIFYVYAKGVSGATADSVSTCPTGSPAASVTTAGGSLYSASGSNSGYCISSKNTGTTSLSNDTWGLSGSVNNTALTALTVGGSGTTLSGTAPTSEPTWSTYGNYSQSIGYGSFTDISGTTGGTNWSKIASRSTTTGAGSDYYKFIYGAHINGTAPGTYSTTLSYVAIAQS
jgi:hypothetical protein